MEKNIVIYLKEINKAFQKPPQRSVCSVDIITLNTKKLTSSLLYSVSLSTLHHQASIFIHGRRRRKMQEHLPSDNSADSRC